MSTKTLVAALALLLSAGLLLNRSSASADPAERFLHVKVEDGANGETVNVNVPLTMAQKVLTSVNKGNLHNGIVKVEGAESNGLDVRALLDAVRTAPDNEFVSVKDKTQDIHVKKSGGNLVVHVRETGKSSQKVDVIVPMKVVDALLANSKQNEIDVSAAIAALNAAGDTFQVTVEDSDQHVRIWVDSVSSSQ